MSRGYFQRLIGRTLGEAAVRLAPAAPPPRLGGDGADPFETIAPIAESAPRTVAPQQVTAERRVITETVHELAPANAAPITAAPISPVRPVSFPTALPPREPAATRATVLSAPESPSSTSPLVARELPTLRPPAERETVVDRWLAPAPSPLVPREPAAVPAATSVAPPPPPKLAPLSPAPPVVAPLPIAAHAHVPVPPPPVDRRPALAIGRLIVEVTPAPPAPAAPVTTIVHTAAPAGPRPLPNVLDRGFGLAQS